MKQAKRQLQRAINHLIEAQKHFHTLDNEYGEIDYYITELEYMVERVSEDESIPSHAKKF
jgi:uncharacterized protein YdcH (DUF465 family)